MYESLGFFGSMVILMMLSLIVSSLVLLWRLSRTFFRSKPLGDSIVSESTNEKSLVDNSQVGEFSNQVISTAEIKPARKEHREKRVQLRKQGTPSIHHPA
jgi:hypothetical protein